MQNRSVCEVFTPQGALSDIGTNHSKLVRREYSKLLRCSVLVLEGDSTRVSLPRSQKVPGLRLTHPILALQLIAPTGSTCLDLVLEDASGIKSGASSRKRITFNMQRQQAVIQGDVARLPFSLPRDTWMLLCIDLPQLLSACFGASCRHKTLECITLGSWCSLRRIFTLKHPIPLSYAPGDGSLPKSVDFPYGTQCSLVSVSVSRTPRPEADSVPVPIPTRDSESDALDEFLDQAAGIGGKPALSLCPTVSQLQPKQQKLPFSIPLQATASSPRNHSPSSVSCGRSSRDGSAPNISAGGFEYQHHPEDHDLRRPVSATTRPSRQSQAIQSSSNPFIESDVNGWTIDTTNSIKFECNYQKCDYLSEIRGLPGEEDNEYASERYWGCCDRSTEDSPISARE
eukprot:TRINITY_DN8638_c0_g1_i2.p1 TRINITY_DN8638_c0_g1~~TRINITY_DN8638_c0_g1_i2.p1  ORF type:complete len:399 (+),score=51.57 TRINITY_DN8638_c0_g1_i2:89-1285(+)